MSSSLKVSDEDQSRNILKVGLNNNLHIRVLKSKENVCKANCSRALKRKLKKYKLRRDGKEDPDIINVSNVLVSSLKIKSPNSQDIIKSNRGNQQNETFPRNYLFKMVRQKKTCLKSDVNKVQNGRDLKSVENSPELLSIANEVKTSDTRMNAFKLMMDSRNKSIGSNSPGKEKIRDEDELKEIIKKKELKAKRILSLEKMAQEKGSIKNKEKEEFREECIKTQMTKRAEKLKSMIEGNNSKSQKRTNNNLSKECLLSDHEDGDLLSPKSPDKIKGTLKLFNFLSESDHCFIKTKDIEKVTKEEQEFLNKLSPSIRKKENMLSYFKKVPKDLELEEENSDSVIKVKLTKSKKKIKHSKANKVSNDENTDKNRTNLKDPDSTNQREKRKREPSDLNNTSKKNIVEEANVKELNGNERPKRNAKKPAKYTDDILFTSSDEELHIFTPKKKRVLDKKVEGKEINVSETKRTVSKEKISVDLNSKIKHKSADSKEHTKKNKTDKQLEHNKNVKLAPIFVTKVPQTPLDLEAKQKFLQSGVPDILKIKTQQSNTISTINSFDVVVHIQQLENYENINKRDFFQFNEDFSLQKVDDMDLNIFETLVTSEACSSMNTPYSKQSPGKLLKSLKNSYPKFPVYRTYQLLKSKCQGELRECSIQELDNSVEIANSLNDISSDNPESLAWNEKYRATSSKQIIGNFESIKVLKQWLESWTENVSKDKSSPSYESDLSDFCISDTDTDSKDTFRHSNNILIITGKVGTGKTSSVYAVASELAIKVIEVNASSKRTGKIMLQDLQEATQSHKVNRGSTRDSSQKSQETNMILKHSKKRGRPKKTYDINQRKSSQNPENNQKEVSSQLEKSSQESSRTGMSLILIDDADIIFEQDDGFCSALSQLIHSSKRPVILITSSLTCPHLQKFLMGGKIIHMHPLLPKMLGTWLDIMCLADTNFCYPGLGSKVLNYYNGDIRKTINFLQYFMTSDKYLNKVEDQTLSQMANTVNGNLDDENSSMSWTDSEPTDNNEKKFGTHLTFLDKLFSTSNTDCYKNLYNVWWSVPSLIHNSSVKSKSNEEINCKKIAKTLDYLSFIDTLNTKNHRLDLDLTSNLWQSNEEVSVLENESFDCYSKSEEIIFEISNDLTSRAMFVSKLSNINPPTMSEQRQRNKIVSRHKTLTSHLYPTSTLDRKALALDYWSFCRTICRTERTKTDINLKRNNRFCHYLKSVNVLCKNEFFDSLSESFS